MSPHCLFGCREDIAWTLQTLSPNALELSRLWHDSGYVSARLLDVASRELQDRLPVKVDTLMFAARCL
jgi:dynein heavy chain